MLTQVKRIASQIHRWKLPEGAGDYLFNRGELVPFLLAAWTKDDGISNCFDTAFAYAMEVDFYPTWLAAFRLDDPTAARRAFSQLRKFNAWQSAMDDLLEALNAE